jgi:hypothetical protein
MIRYSTVKSRILNVERIGNNFLAEIGELTFIIEQYARVNYDVSIKCTIGDQDAIDSLSIEVEDTPSSNQLIEDLHKMLKDTRIIRWTITITGDTN